MKKRTALLRTFNSCINLAPGIQGITANCQSIAWYSRFPKSILLLSMLFAFSASVYAQRSDKSDKDLIQEKINAFFESLATQDTMLFKSVTLPGGQTWAVKTVADSVRISMRSFEDRVKKFINPDQVIQERAFDFEIRIHHQVAMAWVPYTLDVSGRFEHCGIDIFTLVKNKEGWKIVTLAFTMEPEGCDEIKKTIRRKK
ncbi:MAG: nuclear transport factor 2 family protein [Saprospiraceae bacterium]|nr:nuclear transport factor 2 family protein [Candidatus Opimibacter iunctus]